MMIAQGQSRKLSFTAYSIGGGRLADDGPFRSPSHAENEVGANVAVASAFDKRALDTCLELVRRSD